MVKVDCAHLSTGFEIDGKKGLCSLIGIFDNLIYSESKDKPQSFSITVFYSGDVGETFKQNIAIISPSGVVVKEYTEGNATFKSKRYRTFYALEDIIISERGTYAVNVIIDGICAHSECFTVK